MDAYVFQAALLCGPCGESSELRCRLIAQGIDGDNPPEDSDRWPQGPYSHGGGEADCPQHCDHCHAFLENPLTEDGAQYVAEKAGAFTIGGGVTADGDESWEDVAKKAEANGSHAVAQWIRFYLAPGQ